LADAADSGDDAKLVDELGDVLFQVYFLALLLEEREAGSLAEVADGTVQKLIRRHPHVFGTEQGGHHRSTPASEASPRITGRPSGSLAEDVLRADDVLRNWDRIKLEEEGRGAGEPFADVPEVLPALLYARKVQRRAQSAGLAGAEPEPEIAHPATRQATERWIGEALFALVDLARRLRVDPELALRASAKRFRDRVGDR
jgi:XTP/dITP diphosphohydrolase/tetrapyrrole methylase family protein/MazG family protein/ATP diphosphatase